MVSLSCGLYGERSAMEAAPPQEEVIPTPSREQSLVVKGKRTKRQRPHSPLPFAAGNSDNDDNQNFKYSPSPVTSAENIHDGAEEEDQDMANCLILLAQGHSRRSSPQPPKQVLQSPPPPPSPTDAAAAAVDDGAGVAAFSNNKHSNKRFLEATQAAAAVNKYNSNNYAYECKTCNRSFPSFQALGGHRASHKKPKAMAAEMMAENKRNQLFGLPSDDEDQAQFKTSINTNNNSSTALSLQLSNNRSSAINSNNLYGSTNFVNKASKVHECSICGAEFTSGQALGGHMRRHRAPVAATATSTALSLTTTATHTPPSSTQLMSLDHRPHQPQHQSNLDHEQGQQQQRRRFHQQPNKTRSVLSLDLDLNLPAPEDDQREPKFGKQQQQQQQQSSTLVFSAPALVDCHY